VTDYYDRRLAGSRLRRCYELASPRVQQYLEAEIEHLLSRVGREDDVLELGCGYGRVALRLADSVRRVVGIDTAQESLGLARAQAGDRTNYEFALMDAVDMSFPDGTFDVVACVQNGICAFGVDPERLLREALRVAKPGGRLLFSSYSERFWDERLSWFEAQSAAGLVGAIDMRATGNGVIVCEDGFRAGAMSAAGFEALCRFLGVEGDILEVDGSSLFCEISRRLRPAPFSDSV